MVTSVKSEDSEDAEGLKEGHFEGPFTKNSMFKGLHGLTRRRTYNALLGLVSSEIVSARDPCLIVCERLLVQHGPFVGRGQGGVQSHDLFSPSSDSQDGSSATVLAQAIFAQ